uniref:Uncharacterized protein n=1 Tax=Picea sitchensis TaxID=3332 RepID=D5ABS6_PICSI|nr:unknown [Picea sitchensis]
MEDDSLRFTVSETCCRYAIILFMPYVERMLSAIHLYVSVIQDLLLLEEDCRMTLNHSLALNDASREWPSQHPCICSSWL